MEITDRRLCIVYNRRQLIDTFACCICLVVRKRRDDEPKLLAQSRMNYKTKKGRVLQNMKKVIVILMAIDILIGLAACTSAPQGTTATETKQTQQTDTKDTSAGTSSAKPLVIGTSQPLSGTNAAIGQEQINGAMLAIKQINERGGLNGQQVELISYDDQGIPEEAVKITSKLVEVDKVDLIMGSLISSNMLACGNYINENKILCIGTGLSNTWMEQGWEYVWRACVNNGATMPVLAQKVYDMGVRSVGVLHGQDDANASAFKAFADKAESLGMTISTEETYVEGDSDFSGQIAKILNTNPDAVLMSSHSSAQGSFIKQLRALGYTGLALCKEPFTIEAIDLAGSASDNVAFIYPYVTYASIDDCDNPQMKQFLEEYVAEFGYLPTHDCAYRGYDTISVLAAAAEKAGSNKSDDIIEALKTIDHFEALVGTLDYTVGDREGLHGDINGFIVLDNKYVDLDSWIADGGYDKLNQ